MLFCLCEEWQNDKSTVFIATIDFQKLWELGFTVEDLDRDPGGFFELDQFATFSVVEVGGNTFVNSNLDLANTWLLACEHEDTCYFDRHAFCGFHQSSAFAARAVLVDAPLEAWSDPLARHLDQAEGTCPQNFGTCAIALHCISQGLFDLAAVGILSHIDKVVDDDPAEVSQSKLSCDFLGCGQV